MFVNLAAYRYLMPKTRNRLIFGGGGWGVGDMHVCDMWMWDYVSSKTRRMVAVVNPVHL